MIAAFVFPSLAAVPVALVTGYLWRVMPMAFEPLWLRHLNGYWPTCCRVDQVPAWAGVVRSPLWHGSATYYFRCLHPMFMDLEILASKRLNAQVSQR